MTPILRTYQETLISKVQAEALKGHRRILVQSACGSGKTVCFSKMIHYAQGNGKRILVLVHRRELLDQTIEKLERYDVPCGIIRQDDPHDSTLPVQVASIQTFHSRVLRRKKICLPSADLIIVDEVHHQKSARTWQEIINLYPEAYIVGFTATPTDKQGRGMGALYDALVIGPSVKELQEQGHLVKVRYFCPSIPDLQGIKVRAGDYAEDELERKMDKVSLIGDIAENWSRICPTRKTLIYASGILHSLHIVDKFKSIGVKAAHLDGNTPMDERDQIFKDFKEGDLQIISSVGVMTEGTDLPMASALVFARPTKSLLLYMQVAGRILRPYPGKDDAVFLDHSGVLYEFGLIDEHREWTLDCDFSPQAMKEKSKKKKDPKPITCEKCKCLYGGRLDCPECGWKPTIRGKDIHTYEAFLTELDKATRPPAPDMAAWWRGFLHYAKTHNYKRGFAFHKFVQKFKMNPPNAYWKMEPEEPSLEVLSYLKSQQIRWANRRRQERKYVQQNIPLQG